MKLSICIPVFIRNNLDLFFLERCINSVKNQTFDDYELVIFTQNKSDYSKVKEVCLNSILPPDFTDKIKICYKQCDKAIQNWNNCLLVAQGEYIQLLHMDDFYANNNSLSFMMEKMQTESKQWAIFSCCNIKLFDHNDYNIVQPRQINNIMQFKEHVCNGLNYYGNPSCIIHKNCKLKYDENLINIVDLDYYFQLLLELGKPHIYNGSPLMNITISDNQISSTITEEIQQQEIKYLKEKWDNF